MASYSTLQSATDLSSPDVVTWIRYQDGQRSDVPPETCGVDEPHESGLTVCVCTFQRPASLIRVLDSLPDQTMTPERVLIVDASPNGETEQAFAAYEHAGELGQEVLYFRVGGKFKTLTCSRNFSLAWVRTDLMVFFDDDVELQQDCLEHMVAPHREYEGVVGVGGYATNYFKQPSRRWRLRKLLGIVSDLKPGRFCRSGMATPWSFLEPGDAIVEGEWLSGFAMMWKTQLAKQVQFNEGFGGHSTGEDDDFSLRMGRHGKLLVAGNARLLHLTDTAGRPNTYRMGYTGIKNNFDIHRRCLPNRTWRDGLRFAYAYGMDALMRTVNLVVPGDRRRRFDFLRGRAKFLFEVVTGRFKLSRDPE